MNSAFPGGIRGLVACAGIVMTASVGLGQAQFEADKHQDLIVNSLDWPVGQINEYRIETIAYDNPNGGSEVVYDDVVAMPGMAWLRLYFGNVSLDRGSYLRVTSLRDGEQQRLDAATLEMWSHTSAYFNGDAVRVELVAGPFSQGNVLEIEYVASEPISPEGRGDSCGICGPDDRAPVNNSSNNFARIMPVGCSATIYNEASCFVTAGHCLESGATVLHFNVPASSGNCQTNNPPVADQFPVTFSDGVNAGVGADYGAMTAGTNSEGQTPYERYGTFIPLASSVPSSGNLDITGYGVDSQCTRSQTEQYHGGPILSVNSDTIIYEVDVTYGNSGSSILYNNEIVGVVTHCSNGCENYGNRIDTNEFQALIASVCNGEEPPGGGPENDECAGAIVTGTGLTDFTTVDGTSSSDAYDASLCPDTYLGDMNDDVWFSYTPSASGTLTVSTCDLVNFDTDLVVYQGTCGNKSQVACNGDGSDCSGYSSLLTVDVTSGSQYLIRVGGWDGNSTGSGQLSLALEGLPDPTGACCIGGSCSISTAAECANNGGEYQGDDSDCSGDPCFIPPATGGCCVNGNCLLVTEDECGTAGGKYLGDDSDCSGDPCFVPPATGACCVGGNCSVGTEDNCDSLGGTYQGDDSNCNGDPCFVPPATGACCVGSDCSVGTEAECGSLGGAYQGDDSDCSGEPCNVEPPSDIAFTHSIVGTNLLSNGDFNWTVDVYVSVPSGNRVDAVAGTGATQKVLTSTGLFYQNANGGPLSTDVNPNFYQFDPDLEWDSRLTIGALDSSGNPYAGNELGTIGIDFTDFENGLGLAADNGLWYVLPSEAQGEAQSFIGSDCQERQGVLVARLTNFGEETEVQFQALVQGRDSASDPWQVSLDSTFGYVATEDCNENGVSDTCDIANGTSTDADGDGVPDECDSGCVGDFDGNGQTNIDDILLIIGSWENPYNVEDLLSILDNYNCGG